MQEIKTRMSEIILDRAKRTAWETQDPEDRQDYTEPRFTRTKNQEDRQE
jgi:hypothetical protein